MVTIDQPIRSRVFFLLSTSLKLSVGFFGGFYASVYVSLSVEKKKNGGEKDFGFRLPSTEKKKENDDIVCHLLFYSRFLSL